MKRPTIHRLNSLVKAAIGKRLTYKALTSLPPTCIHTNRWEVYRKLPGLDKATRGRRRLNQAGCINPLKF